MITRRDFLKTSAAAALLATPAAALAAGADTKSEGTQLKLRGKSAFTLWQIPSHKNTIGNSYVMRTTTGKVVVMDGGMPEEAFTLRGFLGALGNEVEAWFISHPHIDHMGALREILADPQDLNIRHIYHSRISEAVKMSEKQNAPDTDKFYGLLDTTKTPVTDIREAGETYTFDGLNIKILSVVNDEFMGYNNQSMIMRAWDKRKSITFLADAEPKCGDKALHGKFRNDLHCDYLQMAHHGALGCSRELYFYVKCRACLWPTPLWVWNNDYGKGFNTGPLVTLTTRQWMREKGITEHHVTCTDGIWRLD